MQIINDKGALYNILGSAGSATGNLMRYFQDQREAQEKKDLLKTQSAGIKAQLAKHGYSDEDLSWLSPKQLQDVLKGSITEGPKKQKAQQEQTEGLNKIFERINEARSLYEETSFLDPYKAENKTAILKDLLNDLRSNDLVKKAGVIIPDVDVKSALPQMLAQAEAGLRQSYKMPSEQRPEQQQQEPEQQRLPEQLAQPKNVQGMQQPGFDVSGLPGALAGGIAGAPAGAVGLLNSLANIVKTPQKILAERLGLVPEHLKKEYREGSSTPGVEALQSILPTREGVEKNLGGGGYEGETNASKAAREFAGDVGEQVAFTALTGGVGPALQGMTKVLKNAGIVQGAGNMAKYLMKSLGHSDNDAQLAKVGTTLAMAFGTAPSLKKISEEIYKKRDAAIPANLVIEDPKVADVVRDTREYFHRLGSGFGKPSAAMDKLNGPNLKWRDTFEFMTDLNTRDINNEVSRTWIKDFTDHVKEGLMAQKDVPQSAKKFYDDANNIYRSYKESQRAVEFLKSTPGIQRYARTDGLGSIGLLAGAALGSKPIALASILGFAGGQANKMRYALKNYFGHPSVRNAYNEMMMASLRGSSNAATKAADQLDKAIRGIDARKTKPSKR